MSTKIKADIHIKILEYAQKHGEFTARQLVDGIKLNQNEKNLFYEKLINDKLLLQNTGRNKKTNIGEESILTISTEGRFKLLEYQQLKNATKFSKIAIRIATITTIITCGALIVAIYTLKINQRTLEKTQQSLELSSFPTITIDAETAIINSAYLKRPGHIITKDSKANLILKNNFIGDIIDVDIQMILLEMYVDKKSSHITVCPFGYIDFTSNPEFIVREQRQTTSILDNKKFNLKSLEEYKFLIDYKNIEKFTKTASSSYFLIKIDVAYRRKIDNKLFNYSKIYNVHNLKIGSGKNQGLVENFLVDTDIDRKIIKYDDKHNEILSKTDYNFPIFIVYPFLEEEFVEVVKSKMIHPYSIIPSSCEYFKMDKERNLIK